VSRRVAVVGGGAVGATAAHDLAVRGADVTLYEKGKVGGGSTARAAGIAYDAFAEDIDAAVAARSLDRFRALAEASRFAFDDTPYLFFATEAGAEVDAIRDAVERMRDHGRDVETVSASGIRRRFPQLVCEDIHTAAIAENAGVAEPESYAETMAERAAELGARVREHTSVAVRTDPSRVVIDGEETVYDDVLVAAGAHTRPLLADAGIEATLRAYRVQALRASGPAIPTFYDASAGYYARPTRRGILAGDGAESVPSDPDTWDRDADEAFTERTERRLRERLLNFEGQVKTGWAGLCTATPDGDPLLGELGGLYVAAGWHGHGFMRAPALGEAIAAEIVGEGGIDAFDPTRFSGDEEFRIREGMTLGDSG